MYNVNEILNHPVLGWSVYTIEQYYTVYEVLWVSLYHKNTKNLSIVVVHTTLPSTNANTNSLVIMFKAQLT